MSDSVDREAVLEVFGDPANCAICAGVKDDPCSVCVAYNFVITALRSLPASDSGEVERKVEVSPEHNIVYAHIGTPGQASHRQTEVRATVVLDHDEDGKVIGIEVMLPPPLHEFAALEPTDAR